MARLVTGKTGDIVDNYVFTNHYDQAHNVLVYGTKGQPQPGTPTPGTPVADTPTAVPSAPAATATPSGYRLPDGRIRVPSVIGMPEAQAKSLIGSVGLQNSFTNYQGPGDVPAATLNRVPVGAVLSQTPAPGTILSPGTIVYIAVRKA